MITKTQQIAQEVKRRTGRGTMVFNDQLVDGSRSLKVWGWMRADYELAKELLEAQGCRVFSHNFQSYYGTYKVPRVRLHVEENPSA